MKSNFSGNGNGKSGEIAPVTLNVGSRLETLLHPAWLAFIRYCSELQHGEIGLLKVQDGLPVIAEVIKKKVKFAR